ncbi:hypothetical protein DICVIV_05250 [Dictyocaulus viviparus]|uniref:Channel protein, hemolysin III family n=1 Tax=Dictyocaulus viviparus TaxID=29172 RepID=A0A0D8XXR3_DICVI|nr:hypothetical protein DICVIV_05250 [Dictyocaulus viviparus]
MDFSDDALSSSEQQRLLDIMPKSENQNNFEEANVIVLKQEDLKLLGEDSEFDSPIRSVNTVLKEAENFITDGPLQASCNKENQQVLVDEVGVEYSPGKSCQPVEIVVRHKKIVEQPTSDSDDDENVEQRGCGANQLIRLSTVHEGKENGSTSHDRPCSSVDKMSKWTRGHRRAWSMPNAKGDKTTLSVMHNNETKANGSIHKRRVVRYRLNQMKKCVDFPEEEYQSSSAQSGLPIDFRAIPHPDDDDNELEVEINEEEVVIPSESGRGARTIVKKFWEARWKATNFEYLPEWLQDNEYLRTGHRPPLPSFSSCFKSIFALHTETGNIWTHMYGCVAFVGVALWFLTRPSTQVQPMEKYIFSTYFLGAILCLGMSFIFHTVACHSDSVGKLFSKLDYTGITMLIVGSFVPWLYYGFYCRPQPMIIYIFMISILGLLAMIVSLWDKFAEPKYRPLRAGIFVAMGLSAVFPAAHLLLVDGIEFMFKKASLVWMLLMGAMYIGGAVIYATRIPERWFPGRCDLWFQSHQLFHTFVVIAAFIHFHSITEMAQKKLMEGSCAEQLLERYGIESHTSLLGTLFGLDEDPNIKSWDSSLIQ